MKFRYAYQKVLDLKSNEKTQAEWMFSAAVGHLHSEQQSLEQLYTEKKNTAIKIQAEMENCSSIQSLNELQYYVDFLDQCISTKLQDVFRAEQVVENKKIILNDKMLDEKVWMKSKEKAQGRFQQEMLLREQNELDEMATVRFAMRAH
jgi:flagellar FliJ protein